MLKMDTETLIKNLDKYAANLEINDLISENTVEGKQKVI